eukprot:2066336-Ditylum_brightwellii.AAC.1
MARACGVSRLLCVNIATACLWCAKAKAIYLSSKPDAKEMRLSFLSDNEDIPIKDREDEADQIIQRIIKRKESQSTWRHINATGDIQRMGSVHKVTSSNGNLQICHTTQEEVEKCIIDE